MADHPNTALMGDGQSATDDVNAAKVVPTGAGQLAMDKINAARAAAMEDLGLYRRLNLVLEGEKTHVDLKELDAKKRIHKKGTEEWRQYQKNSAKISAWKSLAISDDANADEPDDPDMGYGQSHRKQLMEAMRTRPTGPARKHAMGHTPSYHKDQKLRTPMTGRPGTSHPPGYVFHGPRVVSHAQFQQRGIPPLPMDLGIHARTMSLQYHPVTPNPYTSRGVMNPPPGMPSGTPGKLSAGPRVVKPLPLSNKPHNIAGSSGLGHRPSLPFEDKRPVPAPATPGGPNAAQKGGISPLKGRPSPVPAPPTIGVSLAAQKGGKTSPQGRPAPLVNKQPNCSVPNPNVNMRLVANRAATKLNQYQLSDPDTFMSASKKPFVFNPSVLSPVYSRMIKFVPEEAATVPKASEGPRAHSPSRAQFALTTGTLLDLDDTASTNVQDSAKDVTNNSLDSLLKAFDFVSEQELLGLSSSFLSPRDGLDASDLSSESDDDNPSAASQSGGSSDVQPDSGRKSANGFPTNFSEHKNGINSGFPPAPNVLEDMDSEMASLSSSFAALVLQPIPKDKGLSAPAKSAEQSGDDTANELIMPAPSEAPEVTTANENSPAVPRNGLSTSLSALAPAFTVEPTPSVASSAAPEVMATKWSGPAILKNWFFGSRHVSDPSKLSSVGCQPTLIPEIPPQVAQKVESVLDEGASATVPSPLSSNASERHVAKARLEAGRALRAFSGNLGQSRWASDQSLPRPRAITLSSSWQPSRHVSSLSASDLPRLRSKAIPIKHPDEVGFGKQREEEREEEQKENDLSGQGGEEAGWR